MALTEIFKTFDAGAPYMRTGLSNHGVLLEQCGEELSLVRFFLKFGVMEHVVKTHLAQLCKVLDIKAVKFGEKRLTAKSRLSETQFLRCELCLAHWYRQCAQP